MKHTTPTILLFSIVLYVLNTAQWWLCFWSPLPIPEFIPNTPISISGLLLILSMITTLIFAQKALLKTNKHLTIVELTIIGAVICFFAEVSFQSTRLFEILDHKFYYWCRGVIVITLYGGMLSFLIAFQLKTKKTNVLWLFITTFCLILYFIKRQFLS